MLPTLMPGGDGLLDVLDHARAVQRLGDDRVVLARGDRVLELLDLLAGSRFASKTVRLALPAAAAALAAASIGAS